MSHAAQDVVDYYETNTASFLRYGQGGSIATMHRAVWGNGVSNREEAFHYVHKLILDELDPVSKGEKQTVLDLGCGVGAALFYLTERRPVHGIGITISRVQRDIAQQLHSRIAPRLAKHSSALTFEERDFCRLQESDFEIPAVDLAFAIESFLHGESPKTFFENVAPLIRTGGRLIICDDFLSMRANPRERLSPSEDRWLSDFQHGWRVGTLVTLERASQLAEDQGFRLIRDTNLTSQLELNRPRDIVIRTLTSLGGWLPIEHPRWLKLVGGNALQRCLLNDLVEYRFVVWERT